MGILSAALLSACSQVSRPHPEYGAPLQDDTAVESPAAEDSATTAQAEAADDVPDQDAAEPAQEDTSAVSMSQNAPLLHRAEAAPAPNDLAEFTPSNEDEEPDDLKLPNDAEDEAAGIIQPSPEQIAAAVKMLQDQYEAEAAGLPIDYPEPTPKKSALATIREKAHNAARAQNMADTGRGATPRPVIYPPSSQPVRQLPLIDKQQYDSEPRPPMPYPAEQRGLRSPALPKLLPIDISGKIHT